MDNLFQTPKEQSADISECGLYRYTLHRVFSEISVNVIAFVMLNPSTADDQNDDPTIRRCIDYAKRWDYDELLVLNIFAYRSTDPAKLKTVYDPVGRLNEKAFKHNLSFVSEVVCAWGNHGSLAVEGIPQSIRALHWIQSAGLTPMALRITKSGQPAHPLYLPKHLKPFKICITQTGNQI